MNEQKAPSVTARLDRKQYDSSRHSTAYLLVDVTAPALTTDHERPAQPLNLGLVLDASGSMDADPSSFRVRGGYGETRLDAAKRAGAGIIENLTDEDTLSVVSFADEALTHVSTMGMDVNGKAGALQAIDSLKTRGCTDLNQGWLKGAEHVARHMESHAGGRNCVLLLSDGLANRGVVEPDTLADTAMGLCSRGVYTSTVGIGVDYSTDQLEVLAEHGGGMMHHAERGEDIVGVIVAELRDMQMAIVNDVRVSLSVDASDAGDGPDTNIRASVLGLIAEDHDGLAVAPLGSMVSGASRQVVFRIDFPSTDLEREVPMSLTVTYRQDDEVQSITRKVSPVSLAPQVRSRVHPEVGSIVAERWLGSVARRAMELNRGENFQELRSWLNKQVQLFTQYCRSLPGGEERVIKMRRLCSRSVRPMRESFRKEISLSHYKNMKGMADYRREAPRSWDSFLDEE